MTVDGQGICPVHTTPRLGRGSGNGVGTGRNGVDGISTTGTCNSCCNLSGTRQEANIAVGQARCSGVVVTEQTSKRRGRSDFNVVEERIVTVV